MKSFSLIVLLALGAGTSACVNQNAQTGEMIPRGNQKYPWDKVVELAKGLKTGMSKQDVLFQMGSAAEIDAEDNLWIYLPERYGILVPAQALRLEFKDNTLVEFGYRAIVLGTRL